MKVETNILYKYCKNAIIALLLFIGSLNAQEQVSYSLAFSAKDIPSQNLIIRSDSWARMEWMPDAVGEHFAMGIVCEITDSTIVLFPRDPDRSIKTVFKKVEGGLINETDSIIYVSNSRLHYRQYYIDGNYYSYGLKTKPINTFHQLEDPMPKKLRKELQKIGENPNCYVIKDYVGFEAYHNFGIDGVFGVTIIDKKTIAHNGRFSYKERLFKQLKIFIRAIN